MFQFSYSSFLLFLFTFPSPLLYNILPSFPSPTSLSPPVPPRPFKIKVLLRKKKWKHFLVEIHIKVWLPLADSSCSYVLQFFKNRKLFPRCVKSKPNERTEMLPTPLQAMMSLSSRLDRYNVQPHNDNSAKHWTSTEKNIWIDISLLLRSCKCVVLWRKYPWRD